MVSLCGRGFDSLQLHYVTPEGPHPREGSSQAKRLKEPSRGWECLHRNASGDGGSRTLVRTRKPYAFYTLILVLIFVLQQDPSHQLQPYPLKLHPCIEACKGYFRFNLRRLFSGFGTTSSERRLVSSPCEEIKRKIYCTSIKQREHTCCCQLIFCSLRFRR